MDRSNTICDLENWRYNGVDIEKHKPKAFLDYQKPGKHPYGNKIEHLQNSKGNSHEPSSPETHYQDGINLVKNEKTVSGLGLKSAENENLTRSYESLEAACMAWKMKIESYKTKITVTEYEHQKVEMISCDLSSNDTKEYDVNSNDVQGMCNTWMNTRNVVQSTKCIPGTE
ncbi:hypothetical protein F8M41_000800 [Gigaspora margarita]|uniref:Uncharacterized protein n=1 Tax=Gigaspora margarita TaxID=4874 RepID=A0A8H3XFI3_GIGMA|nr:hypothetical protein F8M41_000800 [Gigaspora margarita]